MYIYSTNEEVSQMDLQEKLRAYVLDALTRRMVGTAESGKNPTVKYNYLYNHILRIATLGSGVDGTLDMSISDIISLYDDIFLWCYNVLLPQALKAIVNSVNRVDFTEKIRDEYECWLIHCNFENEDPAITKSVYKDIHRRVNEAYRECVDSKLFACGASQTQRNRVLAKLKL